MADFDPNQVLPGSKNTEKVSVEQFTKHLEEADAQAVQLATKANNIYHKMHPEDDIKTNIYDKADFLDEGHRVIIPEEVMKLFKDYEEKKIKDKEEKDNKKPSAEELKNTITNSVLPEEKVKKHPVFDKLMASFGLSPEAKQKTISHTINGLKITFEYPSSLISNFALAYASSEHIGSLDFGFSLQLMTMALSVVEIDDVPVTTALNLTDDYKNYSDIPPRIRKICGVRMANFFQSIRDKDLEKFMSFYSDNIGFSEDTDIDSKEFVEVKCPKCGRTELVAVTGKEIVRYCRDDGSLMEAQSSNKTDENAPLG